MPLTPFGLEFPYTSKQLTVVLQESTTVMVGTGDTKFLIIKYIEIIVHFERVTITIVIFQIASDVCGLRLVPISSSFVNIINFSNEPHFLLHCRYSHFDNCLVILIFIYYFLALPPANHRHLSFVGFQFISMNFCLLFSRSLFVCIIPLLSPLRGCLWSRIFLEILVSSEFLLRV